MKLLLTTGLRYLITISCLMTNGLLTNNAAFRILGYLVQIKEASTTMTDPLIKALTNNDDFKHNLKSDYISGVKLTSFCYTPVGYKTTKLFKENC